MRMAVPFLMSCELIIIYCVIANSAAKVRILHELTKKSVLFLHFVRCEGVYSGRKLCAQNDNVVAIGECCGEDVVIASVGKFQPSA